MERHLGVSPQGGQWILTAKATAEELDAHFVAIFTPEDAIGRDGKKHEPVYRSGAE
jgi:hypothetical protein